MIAEAQQIAIMQKLFDFGKHRSAISGVVTSNYAAFHKFLPED